ncbi:hypothetical protein IP360_00030 [Helicobacter winghamensis]|nr:hypothetical protein [Helicobacter winghamensis]QOQ98785.1 hypothetical protein A0Z60_00955 [Helicobacter winghamensis]
MMWIKISLFSFFLAFSFSGCFYQNSCGISNSYWDEKSYYYDADGKYHEVCPDNIIYKDKVLKEQEQEEVW